KFLGFGLRHAADEAHTPARSRRDRARAFRVVVRSGAARAGHEVDAVTRQGATRADGAQRRRACDLRTDARERGQPSGRTWTLPLRPDVHDGEGFMFATGIECSNPVAIDANGHRKRIDELELTFHYTRWKEDLHLVRQLGLTYLRYGPPWFRVHVGAGCYDWEFTDAVFAEMRRLGIVPIVDLCHFGVPDWIGDFQNPDWPQLFAEYALAFARRFPWVRLYTPVNEIYVCAKLSTLVGLWNERARGDHRAFVTAIKHLARANLLAIGRILTVRPDAIFIQS